MTAAERTRENTWTEHKDENSSQAGDCDRFIQWEKEMKHCTERAGSILQ